MPKQTRQQTKTTRTVVLTCREANHDAVYIMTVVKVPGGFRVFADFGRRDSKLRHIPLTRTAVLKQDAEYVVNRTISEKTQPGRDRTYKVERSQVAPRVKRADWLVV